MGRHPPHLPGDVNTPPGRRVDQFSGRVADAFTDLDTVLAELEELRAERDALRAQVNDLQTERDNTTRPGGG